MIYVLHSAIRNNIHTIYTRNREENPRTTSPFFLNINDRNTLSSAGEAICFIIKIRELIARKSS